MLFQKARSVLHYPVVLNCTGATMVLCFPNEPEPVPVPALDAAGLALQDCDLMNAIPFDADYDSDVDLRAMTLGMDGDGSYNTNIEDAVGVI